MSLTAKRTLTLSVARGDADSTRYLLSRSKVSAEFTYERSVAEEVAIAATSSRVVPLSGVMTTGRSVYLETTGTVTLTFSGAGGPITVGTPSSGKTGTFQMDYGNFTALTIANPAASGDDVIVNYTICGDA